MTKSGPSAAARSGSPTPQGGSASQKQGSQTMKVPRRPEGTRVIAIANQKGGVGKSTTAVSLGAALAEAGRRVLVLDLDPQGNASTGMGIRHDAREVSVYDIVVGEASIADAVVQTPVPNLWAIPSTIDLAGAEIELVSQFSRELRLRKALEPLREARTYDIVLLDCPPSLGLLTINALAAALELIVPIQCEYYALEGLGQLLRNVSLVQKNINPNLQLTGIVMTMFDPRTKLSEQVVAEVKRYFGDRVYDVIIPRTIRLSEAPGFGQPITVYDPKSKGAESYRRLAKEVDEKPPPSSPMPGMDNLPRVVIARPTDAESPSEDASAEDEAPIPAVHTAPSPAAPASSSRSVREPDAPAAAKPVAQASPKPVTQAAAAKRVPAPASPSLSRPVRGPDGTNASRPVVQIPAPQPDDDDAAHWLEELALEAETQVTPPSTSEVLAEAASRAEATGDVGEDEIWESESAHVDGAVGPPDASPSRGPATPSSDRRVVVIDDDIDIPMSAPVVQAPEGEPRTAGARVGATLEDEESPKKRWRLFRKGGE